MPSIQTQADPWGLIASQTKPLVNTQVNERPYLISQEEQYLGTSTHPTHVYPDAHEHMHIPQISGSDFEILFFNFFDFIIKMRSRKWIKNRQKTLTDPLLYMGRGC